MSLAAGSRQPRNVIATWNAELAFRSVVEATADKAGIEFLRHLVKNLSEALGVDYAFVAEFAGTAERVRTIAFWNANLGDWADNVEYALDGTPCQKVIDGQLCLYQDDVCEKFPDDTDLTLLNARSYLGVPLRGASGQTLGHLAAVHTQPLAEEPRGVAIFEVFANRARVEIERLHAEEVLVRACNDLEVSLERTRFDLDQTKQNLDLAYDELQALLEINQSATRHLQRSMLFDELARSVKPLLPAERFGIEVPTGPESLRVHVLSLDQPARGPMIEEFASAGTVCRWAQENRKFYVSDCCEEIRESFPTTHVVMKREGMESLCALPLLREELSFGALFFMSTEKNAYRDIPVNLLERVATAVACAFDNCLAYEEVSTLNRKLQAENVYLQEEISRSHHFDEIVGQSTAINEVLSLVQTVAATHSTVLILGETGTGKELIARAIHNLSPRSERPLIKVNCSAISAGLVESELFGHVRGAFTGAATSRIGRFEVADGGTIFLDEIGELPLDTQVKLLRVLQEREFEPVGSNQTKRLDVRVIAATNRDLEQDVAEGRFRADLFYRLNIVPIAVPPLRERPGDIELLARYFTERHARDIGKVIGGISAAGMARLKAYDWPGNIRELSNVIERGVVLARDTMLEIGGDLLPAIAETASTSLAVESDAPDAPAERLAENAVRDEPTLVAVQRQHILNTLNRARWIIEGPEGAAALLDIKPSTLRYRMTKLGIRRPAG